MKKFTLFFVFVTLFTLTSCIKTRAQLKENPYDDAGARTVAPRNVETSPAGSLYAVDELKAEITRLTGRIEDIEKGLTTGKSYKDEDIKKIETRLIEVEKTQFEVLERLKGLAVATEKDPKEHLEKAKAAYDDAQYETAVSEVGLFLKSNPKNAEEAIFLRGDSYYRLKEFKKAIVDFSKFPEKYSDSPKMPKALLKIGQSFDALHMKEDAQAFYQELTDKFPKSPEAKELKHQKNSHSDKKSKKKKK
ncbi:MAG: tetratricopeptide repeat protein [Xanthomonadaceae bacterium]|nr:tetratricopeptide repeat protein [Xanthomonadaceae bacterium]